MRELPGWVLTAVRKTTCVGCGRGYSLEVTELVGAGIAVGEVAQAWLVAATCNACHTIGVVTLSRLLERGQEDDGHELVRSALDVDDVLDAHQLLEAWRGDVVGLFT